MAIKKESQMKRKKIDEMRTRWRRKRIGIREEKAILNIFVTKESSKCQSL